MIHVRTIDVDDWPLWRELRLEALREAPYAFGTTLAEWQGEGDTELRWRARLSSVPVNMVAYLNGKAAGMVSGIPPDEDGTTELISMWAAPFARGKGVGDALVTSVIEWARGQHAAKIALDVVETNERAISLYRRHGFVDAAPVACADPCVASERQMVLALQS
ncbi:MAG TPA: GNAT family N-acetyltransferase [Candidatus Baltobacteraceae bacterium]